jgi:hypothetical protein
MIPLASILNVYAFVGRWQTEAVCKISVTGRIPKSSAIRRSSGFTSDDGHTTGHRPRIQQDGDDNIAHLSLVMTAGLCKKSRREALSSLGAFWVLMGEIGPANSAAPITLAEADSAGTRVQRLFRPKPPKVLRPKLDKDFAVLLMRASYNVLDELDCVPMEQFQRDFFIIRSSEYEPYVTSLGPGLVQQGDLTDPYYFDFISFAQYATINREVTQNPSVVFEEKQLVQVRDDEPQQFATRIVRRDPELTNARLVPEHDRRVGLAILDRLDEVFGSTSSSLPKIELGRQPLPDRILEVFVQLVNLFLLNGFAWDGSAGLVTRGSKGTEYCLTLVSPATLWGGQSLQLGQSPLRNDFL